MNTHRCRNRPGFTLVELMTVIAIIVLLIGILIPSLSAARKHAKDASSAGFLSAISKGCELFHTELGRYPVSRGPNPFEVNPSEDPGGNLAQGAHWLAMQLVGVDNRGFVDDNDRKNDSNKDGVIDKDDWIDWYALQPSRTYTRLGPYVDVKASESIRTVRTYLEEHPDLGGTVATANLIPAELKDFGEQAGDWGLGDLPFFVDAWGYPVLYYRANAGADAPFTTKTPSDGKFTVGLYDQSDNALFTGGDGNDGRWPVMTQGWDLTGTGRFPYPTPGSAAHPLADFGYRAKQTDWPDPGTFAAFVCDEAIYAQTERGGSGEGCLWPKNANTFLLISAGKDATYGTGDDITNFGGGGK